MNSTKKELEVSDDVLDGMKDETAPSAAAAISQIAALASGQGSAARQAVETDQTAKKRRRKRNPPATQTIEDVKLYNIQEVAKILGVTTRTIQRYILTTKELDATKIGGRWRITADALKAYLTRGRGEK